ncbi:MAG: YfbR-like 5'-deoxynucleotidase, partial [Anaerobiospirillum sp.]|nr:YfbR-like 5'-deoxynucleotidase [Anaerobiospirillum sp.]
MGVKTNYGGAMTTLTPAEESTFLAWIVRMSLIKRWALMHNFREENVSEHSHQTAVIAHML